MTYVENVIRKNWMIAILPLIAETLQSGESMVGSMERLLNVHSLSSRTLYALTRPTKRRTDLLIVCT